MKKMAKFLGILVLGLLVSTNAYTDDIKDLEVESDEHWRQCFG